MPIRRQVSGQCLHRTLAAGSHVNLGRDMLDTFAPSHLELLVRKAGSVAYQVKQLKNRKYAELLMCHHFVPFAIVTSVWPRSCSVLQRLGPSTESTVRRPTVVYLPDPAGCSSGTTRQCSSSAWHGEALLWSCSLGLGLYLTDCPCPFF